MQSEKRTVLDARSEAPREPIDAIYTLDDYLAPCGVRPVASVNQPLPFDPDVSYRVYFDQSDTPAHGFRPYPLSSDSLTSDNFSRFKQNEEAARGKQ